MCKRHYAAWYYREHSTRTPRRKGPDPNWKPKYNAKVAKRYQSSKKGKATKKAWRDRNLKRLRPLERAGFLKRKYGVTQEEYERKLSEQGGGCAICSSPPPKGKHLCIDHSHKTGSMRGLLCHGCNLTVGFLEKNPQRTLEAFQYLRQYP